MFMLGIVVASSLALGWGIVKMAIALYGIHKVGEWLLPGNEAKLMAGMRKLQLKKGSAEAQFLKELTLTEAGELAREFKKSIANDPISENNMLQAIMSQDTGFRNTLGDGSPSVRGEGVPGQSAPLPTRQLRGSRQDTNAMQAAVSSLTTKTAQQDRVPATIRLTGRPTNG